MRSRASSGSTARPPRRWAATARRSPRPSTGWSATTRWSPISRGGWPGPERPRGRAPPPRPVAGPRRESAGEGDLAAGPLRWRVGRRGVDQVEMAFSANPGEDLRPLAKVVSGGGPPRRTLPRAGGLPPPGEVVCGGGLSRTVRAVRGVLSAAGDVPTMVFDEVDAGIGGRVAEVVGQKLGQIAGGR